MKRFSWVWAGVARVVIGLLLTLLGPALPV
jgi:hypothetical protein